MDRNCTNVVGMGFETCDFLRGVVVIYPELEVIGAGNQPIFARNKSASPDRDVSEFEGLDNGAGFVRPNMDMAFWDLSVRFIDRSCFSCTNRSIKL